MNFASPQPSCESKGRILLEKASCPLSGPNVTGVLCARSGSSEVSTAPAAGAIQSRLAMVASSGETGPSGGLATCGASYELRVSRKAAEQDTFVAAAKAVNNVGDCWYNHDPKQLLNSAGNVDTPRCPVHRNRAGASAQQWKE